MTTNSLLQQTFDNKLYVFKEIFSLIKSNSNDQKNCSKDQNQKNKEKLNFLTKGMKIKKRRLRAFARTRAKKEKYPLVYLVTLTNDRQ